MNSGFATLQAEREQILLDCVSPILPELRDIEPGLYFAFLVLGGLPELNQTIDAIIEKKFGSHNLQFSCTGEAELGWSNNPIIGLDFEFSSKGLFAFFRLVFTGSNARVTLHHIAFPQTTNDPKRNNELLSEFFRSTGNTSLDIR